jgi:IS5 family transposase
MLVKPSNPLQQTFFTTFEEQLRHQHPLYRLAHTIDWSVFEKAFTPLYCSDNGAPAKPIRRMVGLLLLKHIRNLSDERVVEQWEENLYYQYFCGERYAAQGTPCDASELVHFRRRIGKAGMELIFRESVHINGKDSTEPTVCVDTTVQEKNITFPTDDKLYKKIIAKCVAIARQEHVELRQSYTRTMRKLRYQQRFRRRKTHQSLARKADRKIKTIAGRLVRELERKLPADALARHSVSLQLFQRVLAQHRHDKNKIYSLHEPHVACIAKGKAHKQYEFGNKVSVMLTKNSGVIVGALSVESNAYDGHTLAPALEQYQRLHQREVQQAIVDLGYRGMDTIGRTEIITPKKKGQTGYEKTQLRHAHRRRSAIEANISHLKNYYRLGRNFYRAIAGDATNLLLAASAYNCKRMMNQWKEEAKNIVVFIFSSLQKFFDPILANPLAKLAF